VSDRDMMPPADEPTLRLVADALRGDIGILNRAAAADMLDALANALAKINAGDVETLNALADLIPQAVSPHRIAALRALAAKLAAILPPQEGGM
jgi:hypothetical protein